MGICNNRKTLFLVLFCVKRNESVAKLSQENTTTWFHKDKLLEPQRMQQLKLEVVLLTRMMNLFLSILLSSYEKCIIVVQL